MEYVYLVHFFTGEYTDMYYCIHQIKYVLTSELDAKVIVDNENNRLKTRKDYEKQQLAWYEKVKIGQSLFD